MKHEWTEISNMLGRKIQDMDKYLKKWKKEKNEHSEYRKIEAMHNMLKKIQGRKGYCK